MVELPGPAAAALAILTRAPAHGGKSRLFSALGVPPDPALLTSLLLDTLDGTHLPNLRRIVAVEPADACAGVRAIVPADVEVMPQPGGTLGERMRDTMARLFAEGAAVAVLIGSDLPDIRAGTIERALSLLAREPGALVLGPARDGGYYLIAAAGIPDVFDGIEWGGPAVLEQTCRAAARQRQTVHLLDPLRDVDRPDDLAAVRARRTRAWWLSHVASRPRA
jgi:rSAM/selenodomain-associated transferase 1